MSLERDSELGRLLESALAPPTARPGAQARVEQKLGERLPRVRVAPWRWALVAAGLFLCVFGAKLGARVLGLGRTASHAVDPASAIAWVSLDDARAALLDASRLEVEREDARETVVRLVSGTALFHVRKGTGRRFVVEAGLRRVEVVGTVFGVALEGDDARVEVVEGVVRASKGGETALLRAGESSPPGSHLFTLAPRALADLRAPLPASSSRALPEATDPPPSSTPSASPASSSVPAPAHSAKSPPTVGTARTKEPPAVPAGAAGDDGAYRAARDLERSGKLAEATSAYRAVVRAGGAEADDAAFALARLATERGSASAVLAALADYRQSFPAGRYARDVDVLELNAHLKRGDRPAALRDADAFLLRFPADARAWRFRLVRAEEQVRSGNCDAAARELASVPDGAEKKAALAGCAER